MNILDWLPRWLAEDIAFGTNSFTDLVLILGFLLLVFFVVQIRRQSLVSAARRRLPLVIGGWGTRGKSGTERCKAALFHGLGAQVYAKTSGCEAMFIHAHAGQRPRELFLFRPMEKVSIWEMTDSLRTAAALGAQVFLYECMALNPRYVQIIQHAWMRDDCSTLTNAYPDHEDIQGPAGHDVAATIASFLPRGGEAWTAEEHMLPLLRERAAQMACILRPVPAVDQALLTADVMARFPYREHPANIALTQAVGRHLGLEEGFILKEMADHLVPDLGVLRTYPPVAWAGRLLVFTNGMSANERRGALENWRRLGFFEHRCARQPSEWLVGVVNNRADRIARSRVFARMCVIDQPAHRYLCIGTNLSGLRAYIEEALDEFEQRWTLADCHNEEAALARFDAHCEALKWEVRDESLFLVKIDAFLRGAGCDPDRREQLLAREVWRNLVRAAQDITGETRERQMTPCRRAWETQRGALQAVLDEALPTDTGRALMDRVPTAELVDWIGQAWIELRRYRSLRQEIRDALSHDRPLGNLDGDYRALLRDYSRRRFHFIDQVHAPGDAVIDAAFHLVPPGHRAQLVGLQNIKGTGLDFAYRWVDLLETADRCQRLAANPIEERVRAAEQIAAQTLWPLQDARMALAAVQRLLDDPASQDHRLAPVLRQAYDRLHEALPAAMARMATGHQRRHSDTLLEAIEAVIDLVDSVRRRWRYGRILRDLVAQRISHRRAAEELRAITARQKGGWLVALVARWRPERAVDDGSSAARQALPDDLGGRIYDAQAFEEERAQVALYLPQDAR